MHHAVTHLLIACGIYVTSIGVCLWLLDLAWFSPGPALMAASFYPGRERLDAKVNGVWDWTGLLAPTVPFLLLEAFTWFAHGIPPSSWWAPIAISSYLFGGAFRQLQKAYNWRPGPTFLWRLLAGIGLLTLALIQRAL